ncbi:MAG: transketolase [Hyphomicrobiaceae bacterium]|nr:transketolase [Hyphomicrobiaceae bacterium]
MAIGATTAAGKASLKDMANAVRALAMDAVEKAKSGHPGMPMGMADVATVLFAEHMKFDASHPDWIDRDRFVLSAGHGSMLLYALLHLTGTPGMTMDEIKNFRQLGAKTAGHPEYGHAPGIETTTGPLGQGLGNAVGMALAERILNARLGDDIVDHRTWVIAGDGCLMEGISQEAISLAGHLGLGRLIVLFDDNGISIDGPTSLATSEDQIARFKASGWATASVDGHDMAAVSKALAAAKADPSRPWRIACKTRIGFGAPTKEGKASSHGSPLGADEIKGARERIGWPHGPFEIPADVRAAWTAAGARGGQARSAWESRFARLDAGKGEALQHPAGAARKEIAEAIRAAKTFAASETTQRATRVWSEMTIERLVAACPALVGGSADLTGSNNTKAKAQAIVKPGDFSGSYIHYGVREHAMAAAMNGLALHGGLIPYGGTFMAFTDYCRPAIRLSALMGQRVVYVMTHDSIGLGEDGPTHQPVEHLAALRAIPNLHVFRPADGVETAECWALAIAPGSTPSILALTRQNVPNLRTEHTDENLSAMGAYVIKAPAGGKRDVTILATGSEVGLAVAAAELLAKDGIQAAVVSMPSFELFRGQPEAYRFEVLGTAPRVAVEAGVEQGWREWLRHSDRFIGMSGFGGSAPAAKLFEHFGITVAKVSEAARVLVQDR